MTTENVSFRTLFGGARILQRVAAAAHKAWEDDDPVTCSDRLRQYEDDCRTLLRQASEIRGQFEASVGM